MTDDGLVDLAMLDGRVARAFEAVSHELARLATPQGREEARFVDPFGALRDVSGRSTFAALGSFDPGVAGAVHRDALRRWVHELLQVRVSWELTVDEADAEHAPDPALTPRAARDDAAPILKTFDEARRALVEAPHLAVADEAFGRMAELSGPVAAVRREVRARRFEAARRLGLDHPWALVVETGGAAEGAPPEAASPLVGAAPRTASPGASIGTLEALARAVLDATDALASELHKELGSRAGGSVRPALTLYGAFARDAREGWPARLVPRWFEEVFRAVAPRLARPPRLPRAIGGASFLRAAAAWGAALRREAIPRSVPFALARDPYPTEAFAFGGALALAVADRVFARRTLGLSARGADAHARALARTLLQALRTHAGLVLAGMHASPDAATLDDLGARLFGTPLPRELASAWSFGGFSGARRVDAPARLIGSVRAHALHRELVERFDEDWFDNPRAGAHLAAIGAGPIRSSRAPSVADVGAVGRALERAFE